MQAERDHSSSSELAHILTTHQRIPKHGFVRKLQRAPCWDTPCEPSNADPCARELLSEVQRCPVTLKRWIESQNDLLDPDSPVPFVRFLRPLDASDKM